MNRTGSSSAVALIVMVVLAGCDAPCPFSGCLPPPPPPPPAAQNPGGVWGGQSVTAAAPDVFTSFEFDAVGPFSVGTSPTTATFPMALRRRAESVRFI